MSSAPPHPLSKYRWVICVLLFIATTILYIDRQILALVKPILDKQWGNSALTTNDLRDLAAMATRLKSAPDQVSLYLDTRLSPDARQLLANYSAGSAPSPALMEALRNSLNDVITNVSIYESNRFAGLDLSPETRKSVEAGDKVESVPRLNRLLLADAYPQAIRYKYPWDYKQYALATSLFTGAYALGLLLFGAFIDRVGVRVGYAVSIGCWALAAMSHSLVTSVTSFRWVRIAVGGTEAGNFPCAIKAVAHWFPRKERAFATTLFNSGANIGPVIGPAIIPPIAEQLGWRAPFMLAGCAGLLWVTFWFFLYRNDPDQSKAVSPSELAFIKSDRDQSLTNSAKVPWSVLLQHPQTWSFIVAKFLTDPVWWFFLYFLPDYFHSTKGLNLKKLGPPLIILYVIVSVLSILGGWLTNYLIRRGWGPSKSRKFCMFLFALCVLPVMSVKYCGLWGAVMLIGLGGAAHQAWSANLFTTTSDMFPKRAVASVVGLGGMAGSVGGLLFPLFNGWLLDLFKQRGDVNTGYGIIFAICGAAYLLAFGLNHLLAPRFEMVRLPDDESQPSTPPQTAAGTP